MTKPRLLFLTPVEPSARGAGLALRAWANQWALSKLCEVDTVVLEPDPGWRRPLGKLGTLIDPLPLELRQAAVAAKGLDWPPGDFDYIFAFRLRLAPLALAAAARPGGRDAKLILDLDDIESRLEAGAQGLAGWLRQAKLARQERRMIARFDLTLVCSARDRALLERALSGGSIAVAPNIAPPIRAGLPPRRSGPVPRLLFVGLLHYGPNVEGLIWFCQEVLPALRAALGRPFELAIVGRGAGPAVEALAEIPEVKLIGEVEETAPWYAEADLAIVPLQTGGGTRIKILEAFALRCPVVSTSAGAYGLEVSDRQELLMADRPDAFATACTEILGDPALVQGLTERARDRLGRDYSPPALLEHMRLALEALG
ncbi:MAG: glycosyltransferase family 4 protein [Pseudomonadota bacterium]